MAAGGELSDGATSIYGNNFNDENLNLRHYKRGILSMNNNGPDTNNSQFLVTLQDTPWLDGYHVVFGELLEGDEVLNEIENSGSRTGELHEKITIEDCGELRH